MDGGSGWECWRLSRMRFLSPAPSTWAPTWAPPLPVASEYPQHVPVSLSLLDDVFISDRRRHASLTQARSFSLRKR